MVQKPSVQPNRQLRAACPRCKKTLTLNAALAGETTSCTRCFTTLTVVQSANGLQLAAAGVASSRPASSKSVVQPKTSARPKRRSRWRPVFALCALALLIGLGWWWMPTLSAWAWPTSGLAADNAASTVIEERDAVSPQETPLPAEPSPPAVAESVPPVEPAPPEPSPPPRPDVSAAPREYTAEQIVNEYDASVCQLHAGDSLGTGFLVANKLLATNKHVIEDAPNAAVTVIFPALPPNDRLFSATVRFVSTDSDLAILELDAMPRAKILPIHTLAEIRKGERVFFIGNPGGMQNVVTEGLLGSIQTINNQPWLQLSASVNPGNSGGPVITSRGKVAGIVTLRSADQEGIGLAIPGEVLLKALRNLQ